MRRGRRYQIQTFDKNPPHFHGTITGFLKISVSSNDNIITLTIGEILIDQKQQK